jgi:hypothetical protein
VGHENVDLEGEKDSTVVLCNFFSIEWIPVSYPIENDRLEEFTSPDAGFQCRSPTGILIDVNGVGVKAARLPGQHLPSYIKGNRFIFNSFRAFSNSSRNSSSMTDITFPLN